MTCQSKKSQGITASTWKADEEVQSSFNRKKILLAPLALDETHDIYKSLINKQIYY